MTRRSSAPTSVGARLYCAPFRTVPRPVGQERRTIAGLLDVLWSPASYERLVGVWGLDGDDATARDRMADGQGG